jgi:hypothetical protein
MATHPSFREAVEATITGYRLRLWYDFTLYAFPDIAVQLSVYYSVHTKEEFRNILYVSTVNYHFLMWACFMSDGVFLDERVTLYNSMTNGYSRQTLHESFLSRDLIKACEVDEVLARRTAECFKMLHPCGIPPAAYCFASQVELHRLLAELLPLFQHGTTWNSWKWWDECSAFLLKILKRYSIFNEDFSSAQIFLKLVKSVSLDDLKKFLEPGYTSTIVGTRETGKIYNGVTFSLAELARLLTEFIDKNKIHSFKAGKHDELIRIHDRIVKAALRYDITGALKMEMFAPSWVALPLQEGEKSVEELREQDLLNGLSHDPLYRDVLMRSAEPHKTNRTVIKWKRLIKAKIDVIKRQNKSAPLELQPIPAYQDISTHYSFACMTCKENRLEKLSIEDASPFRVFCNEQCRSAMLKY